MRFENDIYFPDHFVTSWKYDAKTTKGTAFCSFCKKDFDYDVKLQISSVKDRLGNRIICPNDILEASFETY
jgi:hypothetical protein